MNRVSAIIQCAISELVYTTSRSGGSGGQHVNKVETKVTLRWSIKYSKCLTDEQRTLLLLKLGRQINQEGELVLYDQSSRSQLKNKELVNTKWKGLVQKAFSTKKKRKPTSPSRQAMAKRRERKSSRSVVKQLRKKPRLDS